MSNKLSKQPKVSASLAGIFEGQRQALGQALASDELSTAQIVTATRKALDLTAERFGAETDDVSLKKASLWLIELVKSSASVLDSGAQAQIVWREVPAAPAKRLASVSLFFMAAAGFAILGWIQESRIAIMASAVLAGLRLFDPRDWRRLLERLPFLPKRRANIIEGPDGTARLADARIIVNSAGFIDGIADSLRTADHILDRLSQPVSEALWHDDSRIVSLVHGLLEARTSDDGDYALRLIDTELASLMRSDGIDTIHYNTKQKRLFDILPALDLTGKGTQTKMAAPALMRGEQVLRRGTVWKGDEG